MPSISRRRFCLLAAGSAAHLALPKPLRATNPCPPTVCPSRPLSRWRPRDDYENFEPPPKSLGRIINWSQPVRAAPDPDARITMQRTHDEIIPLLASVRGTAPWPSNPIWYMTGGGFVHSGYVQPVENKPNDEVIRHVEPPGFWAEVCLPYVRGQWTPGGDAQTRKLYYETVYRVVNAEQDQDGAWWYQLEQGITYNSPGPYVPASSMRRFSQEDLAPLSPERDDKWIKVDIDTETLTCYEGERAVFQTRTASGVFGVGTPVGEFTVLHKRFAWRMVGDDYDLPGIAFPVYFTPQGHAIHGTYWHNDFGRRHSHGCLNVPSRDARWIFRWVDPVADYETTTMKATEGSGTRIIIV